MTGVRELEDDLRELFHRQADAVRPSDAPLYGPPVSERPQRPQRSRSSLAVVCAAACVVLIGGLVAISSRGSDGPASGAGGSGPVNFSSDFVRFTAEDFAIDVDGVVFVGDGDGVAVSSDPGDPSYQTLELTWHEHDVEMRLNIYFASDGIDWWISEMRTYDGRDPGDWVVFKAPQEHLPLGQPFTGSIERSAGNHGVVSTMHIVDLSLQPFLVATPQIKPAVPGVPPTVVLGTSPDAVPIPVPAVPVPQPPNVGSTTESASATTTTSPG